MKKPVAEGVSTLVSVSGDASMGESVMTSAGAAVATRTPSDAAVELKWSGRGAVGAAVA